MNNKEPPKPKVVDSVYSSGEIVYMTFYDPVDEDTSSAHILKTDVELLMKKISEYLEKTKKG